VTVCIPVGIALNCESLELPDVVLGDSLPQHSALSLTTNGGQHGRRYPSGAWGRHVGSPCRASVYVTTFTAQFVKSRTYNARNMLCFRAASPAWLLQCVVYGSASLRSRPSASRTKCCCQAHRGRQSLIMQHYCYVRHWLTVEQRIAFKMAAMTYISAFTARRPITLRITTGLHHLQLPTYTCGQPVPVACLCLGLRLPPWTDPLQLLVHACGSVCLPRSHRQAPWPFSKNNWRLFFI